MSETGKIVLKAVDTKKFSSLLKRTGSIDRLVFLNITGAHLDSIAYNQNKSVVKRVESDLNFYCQEYTNKNENQVKFLFTNVNKFLSALSLVGTDDVNIVLSYEDGFGKKATISNKTISMNIVCGESALAPIEMPAKAKESVFNDYSKLVYGFGIDSKEFKYINSLFDINKDGTKVFFSKYGNVVHVSEIEAKSDAELDKVNSIVANDDYDGFRTWEKLYDKIVETDNVKIANDNENHISAYAKAFFTWVDSDNDFTFEIHENKLKIISTEDETSTKSTVVIMPIQFN